MVVIGDGITKNSDEARGFQIGGLVLFLLAVASGAVLVYFYSLIPNSPPQLTTSTTILINQTTTLLPSTTVGSTTTIQGSVLENYALSLINQDRQTFGLQNVTLAQETSGQQHSDSMLSNRYFSHWDIYGMKPYMRYALIGGKGSVSENIAYRYSSECGVLGCNGNINITTALQKMEYAMMYNDSACCNNGHRDNILDPQHNQVSIGISYNSSTIYFDEDFVDDYIGWDSGTPSYSGSEVSFSGSLENGASLFSVQVTYDPSVKNLTRAQLWNTSSYGYGTTVAGVTSNRLYYYQGIKTILADTYSTSADHFNVDFNMASLINQYHAGEYTVMVWLNNTRKTGFVGATYTIFINSDGQAFTPANI